MRGRVREGRERVRGDVRKRLLAIVGIDLVWGGCKVIVVGEVLWW